MLNNIYKYKVSLFTIKSKMKYLDDFTIKKPKKTDMIYDESEIDEYKSTVDIEKYITKVAKELGIKQDVLDNYLSLFDSEY